MFVILSRGRGAGAPLAILPSTAVSPPSTFEEAAEQARQLSKTNVTMDYFVADLTSKFSAKITVEETLVR